MANTTSTLVTCMRNLRAAMDGSTGAMEAFKAVLQQHEETQRENIRLREQNAGLTQENADLRRALVRAQGSFKKSDALNAEAYNDCANVLNRHQKRRPSTRPMSASPQNEDLPLVKPEDAEINETSSSPSQSAHQSMTKDALVFYLAEDGTISDDLPPEVETQL